jgi:hypothetical protein
MALVDGAELLARHAQEASQQCQLRGSDAFGADAMIDGDPVRIRFSAGPVTKEAWLPTLQRELAAMTLAQPDATR